ncbi:MAG: hypothetical protein NTZ78_00550 [Candidatus Aureabacteria bacterium]|nr:hypothetical protein [Candidatus Auribacterota bacterium]
MRTLIVVIAIATCAMMGTALSAGDPHTVYGKLVNADGTAPAASAMSFKAYIASRPGEVLTEKSPGCEPFQEWRLSPAFPRLMRDPRKSFVSHNSISTHLIPSTNNGS